MTVARAREHAEDLAHCAILVIYVLFLLVRYSEWLITSGLLRVEVGLFLSLIGESDVHVIVAFSVVRLRALRRRCVVFLLPIKEISIELPDRRLLCCLVPLLAPAELLSQSA